MALGSGVDSVPSSMTSTHVQLITNLKWIFPLYAMQHYIWQSLQPFVIAKRF